MRAMILAAGKGERLRPLTLTRPKPLLLVAGKPLIVHHILNLKRAGFSDIVINHAWLGEQIETALGSGAQYGVRLHYSAEQVGGLETAGGIKKALPLLSDDMFLVVNGDIFTDFDFQTCAQMASQLPRETLAHVWLVPNPCHHPDGDFFLHHQEVRLEKPGERYTFSGIGLYRAELFSKLLLGKKAPLGPLLRQAAKVRQLTGSLHAGLWIDVGTPERLAKANASA